jgi:hypothetical protein
LSIGLAAGGSLAAILDGLDAALFSSGPRPDPGATIGQGGVTVEELPHDVRSERKAIRDSAG